MHIMIKEFKRKAKHDWCCDKCHRIILSSTLYKDQEVHYITSTANSVTTVIKHKRMCAICAGYTKDEQKIYKFERPEQKIYRFKRPEPVVDPIDNMKYWLVGVGYKTGTDELCLIVEDWYNDKHYWKSSVMTVDDDLLKPSNVEFV